MKFICIIILISTFTHVLCENDIFVPSSEWKEVKEGEKVPPGLHIRINLQTGKKEAKLPDGKVDKKQALLVTERNNDDSAFEQIRFSELEKTLKNIKNDYHEPSQNIKKKFRSYEEIKKELDSLTLTPKLDLEIIRDLVKDYEVEMSAKKNSTKMISILKDLEYMTHQIDNAIEFISQNGFKSIIYSTLNDTDSDLKILSLRLMSSLMQNNPKVQIHGLETGCLNELLRMLSLDKSNLVKYQAVGALSAILRRFPLAQKRFTENGGLSVITKIFNEGDIKINVRLVTLVMDLVTEHQLSEKTEDVEALKQYKLINLEDKLIKHRWCANVNHLFHSLITTDEDNHDFIEKCLRAMDILAKNCIDSYDFKMLNYLFQKYNKLALDDIDKDEDSSLSSYFSELKDLCYNIIQLNKRNPKTEL